MLLVLSMLLGGVSIYHAAAGIHDKPFQRFFTATLTVQLDDVELEDRAIRLLHVNKLPEHDNMVIVALSNSGMKDMTLNWIASLHQNKFHKFLVFCFDADMHNYLVANELGNNSVIVPRKWLGEFQVDGKFKGWGEREYQDLLRGKIRILMEIWNLGFTIFYNDVDLVFLSPHVIEQMLFDYETRDYDCIYMVDYMDHGFEQMNGGFWIGKPTMKPYWERALVLTQTNGNLVVDQAAINFVLEEEKLKYTSRLRGLSKSLYPSGHYFHQLNMNHRYKIQPLVVHMNFLIGSEPKITMLKLHNMWFI